MLGLYHAKLPWQGLVAGVSFRVIATRRALLQIAILRPRSKKDVLVTVWINRADLDLAIRCGIIAKQS